MRKKVKMSQDNNLKDLELENIKSEFFLTLKELSDDCEVSEKEILKSLIKKIKNDPMEFCEHIDVNCCELVATLFERYIMRVCTE